MSKRRCSHKTVRKVKRSQCPHCSGVGLAYYCDYDNGGGKYYDCHVCKGIGFLSENVQPAQEVKR